MTAGNVQTVRVELGARGYDIKIGARALEGVAGFLTGNHKGRRVGIVTDTNVQKAQLARLTDSLEEAGIDHVVVVVAAGEASKCFATLQDVVEALIAARLERSDIIVALGGGVVGDLAGFAAAITRRGMDFIQVPTSLLAQVDSSVGGKTGINSRQGKNLFGAFHQPLYVAADLSALATLPRREFASGYAELVKHALICDPMLFEWLEVHLDEIIDRGPALATAISRAVAIKAAIVARDEREAGERALLNLGHTFGHALEAAAGYSDRLLHGEAVAVGCVLAHEFSARLGHTSGNEGARVAAHLQRAGLPTTLNDINAALPPARDLMALIGQDKKVVGGALTFILTRGIGGAFIAGDIERGAVEKFLKEHLE
jgi:3-dehydroquinate synthase